MQQRVGHGQKAGWQEQWACGCCRREDRERAAAREKASLRARRRSRLVLLARVLQK